MNKNLITISVPYSEMAHGDIEFTYELPEGVTKEEFLERLKADDDLFWTNSVQEDWIVADGEVEEINYFEATIMEDE